MGTPAAQLTTPPTALLRRALKTYVLPHWRLLSFALTLMLISAAMTGAMAKFMEPIIDDVFTQKNADMLWPVALSIFGVFVIRGIATYGQVVMMNYLGQKVVNTINRDMFAHLIDADLAFFHGTPSGHLLSRFLNDTLQIRIATVESLTGFGKNVFTVIGLVGVMFYQDWKLSLASIFVFPVAFYFVSRTARRLRKVSRNTQVEVGQLTSVLNQAFHGVKHVKSYGMEAFEKKRVGDTLDNILRLVTRSFRISAATTPFSEVLSGLAIITIVIYGGNQVIEGHSTPGKLFSFITAFLLAFDPLKRLANLNNTIQAGIAALDRFFTLMDSRPLIAEKPGAAPLHTANPTVRFENVSFTYADGTQALRNVSFTAPSGKTIALVGESGAGKSTILNLLPRFYDVTEGAITVDGHDIREATIRSLRSNMALVSQEVAIFNDTLRDNIAYGTEGATEEQIINAAKQAAAHDFIMDLPQGYDTLVGENGVKLSGGQRQRISIARAMLKNAPILLLDEATSALDTQSERFVQEALERLQKGKTTIVVAHRLSTIINADIIYVLAQGQLAEQGTHEELLARGGVYARLYGNLLKESD